MSKSSTAPVPCRITLWRLVLAALTLLIWGRFLVFPSLVASTGLDRSWMQALGHFYRTKAQAGIDYVFTYGPLGYFATDVYDAQLYWQRYAWELVIKLASAIAIMAALAGLPWRGLTLLGAGLVLVFVPYHFDTIYLVTLLALGVLLIEGTWPRAAVWLPLLALLSMTKFTYFVMAVGAAVLAELSVRLRGYRGWLSPFLLYWVGVLVVWLWCGQDPRHLGAYCRNSWEIAQGYSEAMAASGGQNDLALAAVTMMLAVGLLLWSVWRQRRNMARLGGVLFLGPGLFLGWKNGLVRHDDHAMLFFGMALFVALMLPRYLGWKSSLISGVLLVCSIGGTLLTADHERHDLFSISIHETEDQLAAALHPVAARNHLEEVRAAKEKDWRLDRVREVVGAATIDQLSCEQGVIFLNGLNWHPRPVFQSYTVYTPNLLRLNADFYRSDDAPEYVLCDLYSIDGRLGAMEDSLALLELLRRYTPVFREKQFVLLKRLRRDEPVSEPEVVRRGTIHFDETIRLDDVPGEYQWLSLRFTPSLRGRVLGAVFKRDILELELQTTSGKTLPYRLIPAMAQEGFLINPLVDSTDDFARLWESSGGDRVVSFRIIPRSNDFQDEIEMTVAIVP